MENLPGSNSVIKTIERIQAKNRELDPDYILKDYYKPESSFRGWLNFFNIFKKPAKLKK